MHVRSYLGLASALALLAACGPSKPSSDVGEEDAGPEGGEADSADSESGGVSEDMGVPEAMCTLDNYANDPQLLAFTEVGCVPVEADGTCAVCDFACMEAIVYDCPIDTCGLPDLPCINECGDHTLLCTEQLGDQCCHLVTASYVGGVPGRPLREHGAPCLPAIQLSGPSHADERSTAAAAHYRELARYERASVDAFLHAAAVLEDLGAPSELIALHGDAARQEAEHARLALAAAEGLDGRAASLVDLTPAPGVFELEAFVRDLIRDGCIGELFAAELGEWAGARVELEVLAEYWGPVARDEAGHAALAWRTLDWLLEARPELAPTVVSELAAAVAAGSETSTDGDETLGLPSSLTEASLRDEVIAGLVADARWVAAAA